MREGEFMVCAYCKNGDHEVLLPSGIECSCVCHEDNWPSSLKTIGGLLVCVAFIAFFWWAVGKLI